MDRRQYLKQIGGVSALGLLAGCGADQAQTNSGGTATEATTTTTTSDTSTETKQTTTVDRASVTYGGDGEINMSLSPSVPQDNLYVQYGPVRDHLEEYVESNYDVPPELDATMNIGSNYSAVIQSLGSGSSDIAETGPFAAALGVKTDNAEVILQRKGYGSWTYKSQIAVPNDSDITSLSDLSGKTVAFSDRLSTSGCLYPLYNMKTNGGVNIGTLPEGNGAQANIDPVFAGGHVQSYTLLKKGQVDAAAMGGFVPGLVDDYEANATTLFVDEGLPRAPIVASPALSEDAKAALQEAFLEAPDRIYLGADGKEGGDDDLWFSAVRKADLETYQSVVDVANELGVGQEIFK